MKTTILTALTLVFAIATSSWAMAQDAPATRVSNFKELVELLDRDGVTFKKEEADQVVSIPTEKGTIDSVLVIRWDSNQ